MLTDESTRSTDATDGTECSRGGVFGLSDIDSDGEYELLESGFAHAGGSVQSNRTRVRKRTETNGDAAMPCPLERAMARRREESSRQPCAKNWVFTLNNPTAAEVIHLQGIDVLYLVFQREIAESGTPHLQGMFCFSKRTTLASVRRVLSFANGDGTEVSCRYFLDVMRGTIKEAEAYCTKEETRDPLGTVFRKGVPPSGQGSRSDLGAIAVLVRNGSSEREIFEADPGAYLRYHGGIRRASILFQGHRTEPTQVYWYFGPTGTGKSRRAGTLSPESYWKSPENKWWDGYTGSEDVIIDDYRTDFCRFSQLLRMFDRYPYKVETKGGSVNFRSRRIFITTPYSPADTWNLKTNEQMQQLYRRLTEVRKFTMEMDFIVANDFTEVIRNNIAN